MANTHNFVLLACAFALIYVATMLPSVLSEAALIDQNPQESTRTMTRWTIMASIGDLLGPILVSPLFCGLGVGQHSAGSPVLHGLAMACIIGLQRFPNGRIQNNE